MTASRASAHAVRRKEDYRFLTGAGQYTDDMTRPHQSYAAFVRSPHAHATIKVDRRPPRRRRRPALLAVYTGEDMRPTASSAGCPAAG